MLVEKTGNGWRVFMTPTEYRIMLDAADSLDAEVAMRLLAASLRVSRVAHRPLNTFKSVDTPYGQIWLCEVDQKNDPSVRNQAMSTREAWIPQRTIDKIRQMNVDFNSDRQLFLNTEATIRNWVKRAGERAAEQTGDRDFLKITPHDFRRYFATHMLYRVGADEEVVRQLGGWKSVRNMQEYLRMPADVVAKELTKHQVLEGDMQTVDPNKAVHSKVNELDMALSNLDESQRQKAEEQLKQILDTDYVQSSFQDL